MLLTNWLELKWQKYHSKPIKAKTNNTVNPDTFLCKALSELRFSNMLYELTHVLIKCNFKSLDKAYCFY